MKIEGNVRKLKYIQEITQDLGWKGIEFISSNEQEEIVWTTNEQKCHVKGVQPILKLLGRAFMDDAVYEGNSNIVMALIEQWMEISLLEVVQWDNDGQDGSHISKIIALMNRAMDTRSYLAANHRTLADYYMKWALERCMEMMKEIELPGSVTAWWKSMKLPEIREVKISSNQSDPHALSATDTAFGLYPSHEVKGRYADILYKIITSCYPLIKLNQGQENGGDNTSACILVPPGRKPVINGPIAALRYLMHSVANHDDNDEELAMIDGWILTADREFLLFHDFAEKISDISLDKFCANMKALDAYLEKRTYLVGQRRTAADCAMAIALKRLSGRLEVLSMGVHVRRWMETIQNQSLSFGKDLPCTSKQTGTSQSPTDDSFRRVHEESENEVLRHLKDTCSMQVETFAHLPAATVEEQRSIVGPHIKGALTKNMFLRDKKHGYYLVSVYHEQDVNTTTLARLLNLPGKVNFRFSSEEDLMQLLHVKPGAVGPLAILNDRQDQKVNIVLDKKLLSFSSVSSHPLRNDRTTVMTPDQLLQFIESTNHSPAIVDFASDQVRADSNDKPRSKEKKAANKKAKEPKETKSSKKKSEKSQSQENRSSKPGLKKETLLAIDKMKEEDFSGWYTQVITYSELIDYSDISGCYILRPWSFAIWEEITKFFDAEIKASLTDGYWLSVFMFVHALTCHDQKKGVQNTYFPLFVSAKALEAEKDHVEGFAPEVAWVTRAGSNDLHEPIAIRPTSETIMYPMFSKWIRSHRDLPLLLNQWSNVVRWEFKYPTPFIRSREFLWQEGHTAHATYEEADEMVIGILDLYADVYEKMCAVPVIKGQKTEKEKFAGGDKTTTCEAFIHGCGRAIQGATSHHLGQNFAKMFDIAFESQDGTRKYPWQTSWGITTRTIGVMIMVHGDNMGLVLPPRIAPIQVIIIPIVHKSVKEAVLDSYLEDIAQRLKDANVRVDIDKRKNYTAGWKYNHWEQKGVPIRVEVGPRDIEKKQVRVVTRFNGDKQDISRDDVSSFIPSHLERIQEQLLEDARRKRDKSIIKILEWKDFVKTVASNNLVLAPFCNEEEWEDIVKKRSKDEALEGEVEDERTATSVAAKSLCIPFEQPPLPEGTKCFISGKPAKCWVLWGRSY